MGDYMPLANYIKNVMESNPSEFAKARGMSRGKILNMLRGGDYFVYKGRFIFKMTDKLID